MIVLIIFLIRKGQNQLVVLHRQWQCTSWFEASVTHISLTLFFIVPPQFVGSFFNHLLSKHIYEVSNFEVAALGYVHMIGFDVESNSHEIRVPFI